MTEVPASPRRLIAVAAVLLLLLGPAPSLQAQTPSSVHVLGGPAAMPEWAVEQVEATTGRTAARLAGADRFATAAAVTRHSHPAGAETVYVATGRDHADALAASSGIAVDDAALVLVEHDSVPAVAAEELRRLAPTRVLALGGPAALSDDVLAQVEAATGRRPVRLAGQDRFATAAAVSRYAFPDEADVVYLADGYGFADAVAASPAVVATGGALLLVASGGLPAATAHELERLRPRQVHVLGGPAAISEEVVDEVAALLGERPGRLAGADRYATAEAIAEHAHPEGAEVLYAASGRGFADALAAASAVAVNGAGLMLVDTRLRWTPSIAAAAAYADARAGSVSFAAIGTDGRLVGSRASTTVPIASVLKVMFLAAYLRQPEVRSRALTAADRALLEPMIQRSANEPATWIANQLGPDPMRDLAAAAGMRDFSYTRPWGLSRTSARDQARFLLELDRHLPARHRAEALQLLTQVVPEQRWGIGEVATPGWTQHFKGGWGAGTGATDHQVAMLEHRDGTRVSLAVMTTNSPSHAYGKDTLRGVFSRLLADLPSPGSE